MRATACATRSWRRVTSCSSCDQSSRRAACLGPCSASGTWRRNPDARWRAGTESAAELNALQLKLLSLAAESVRTEGQLIYATCSWLVSENEAVVDAFLAANPGYSLVSSQMLGVPQTDSDSMFVAVMQRS